MHSGHYPEACVASEPSQQSTSTRSWPAVFAMFGFLTFILRTLA